MLWSYTAQVSDRSPAPNISASCSCPTKRPCPRRTRRLANCSPSAITEGKRNLCRFPRLRLRILLRSLQQRVGVLPLYAVARFHEGERSEGFQLHVSLRIG